MHHRSPLRQLLASVTVATLLASSWAPLAAAQGSQVPPPASPPSPATAPAAAPSSEQTAESPLSDEERREQARAAFEAGQAAFEEENYKAAAESFRKAHALAPSPHAEYWIAVSLDRTGEREADAARAYQSFLANPAASYVGDDKVSQAEERFSELKGSLPARVTVTTEPPGAQISVGGVPQEGRTPLTLELAPGAHRIVATLPDHEAAEAELSLEGGSTVERHLTLEQTPMPPPVEETPAQPAMEAEPTERSLLPAYVTLGLAGAGLVTGTIFGLKALSDRRAYNDNPTTTLADRVERNALLADMAFGVAITLGITGIVLLTSDEPGREQTAKAKKKRSERSFAVAPVVAPNLGGAAALMTF